MQYRNPPRQMRRKSLPRRPPDWWKAKVPREYPWKLLSHLLGDLAPYMRLAPCLELDWVIRSRSIRALLELSDRWNLQCIGSDDCTDHTTKVCKYLLGSILKKYPWEASGYDKQAEALKTWKQAERNCSAYNLRGWKALMCDGKPSEALQLMQQFCLNVLGAVPDLDRLTQKMRHGPGATTSSRRSEANPYFKNMALPYRVASNALDLAKWTISTDERWIGVLESHLRDKYGIQPWCILNQDAFWAEVLSPENTNRVSFVPKTVKTDRSIAVEPLLNVYLQLGVDGFIRHRLKRWGVNLDDQTRNCELARQGSLKECGDSPCTLDLSNASDSVSMRLVKLLLPPDWYRLLCTLRSSKGLLPDRTVERYAKLSSMGNGYTFAIESLVFTAVAYAASVQTRGFYHRDLISVYGDDIIVPKDQYRRTVCLLEDCGFTLNQSKSFSSSNTRESCGTDWIQGVNIRPVLLDERPETIMQVLAHRNLLHRWAALHLGVSLESVDQFLARYIPRDCLRGPCSDMEFDTYWHDEKPGMYHNSTYWFKRYAVRPVDVSSQCTNFNFRKLMVRLTPAAGGVGPESSLRWEGIPPSMWSDIRKSPGVNLSAQLSSAIGSGSGSAFAVVDVSRLRYGVGSNSNAPDWASEYSPFVVKPPRNRGGVHYGPLTLKP